MDPHSSDPGGRAVCTRCRRLARDWADYESWQALDDGAVCSGCLTLLEVAASREDD